MKLKRYLESRRESHGEFGRRAGLNQQVVSRIVAGHGCNIRTAGQIVRASREQPAPRGPHDGTVRYEDLE